MKDSPVKEKIKSFFSELKTEHSLEGAINIGVLSNEGKVLSVEVECELNFIQPIA